MLAFVQSYSQSQARLMFVTTLGIYRWYYDAVEKKVEECLCVEQSRELFSNIRGRGGASNACFYS